MRRCKLCGKAEDSELVGPYCLQCDKIVSDTYADSAAEFCAGLTQVSEVHNNAK